MLPDAQGPQIIPQVVFFSFHDLHVAALLTRFTKIYKDFGIHQRLFEETSLKASILFSSGLQAPPPTPPTSLCIYAKRFIVTKLCLLCRRHPAVGLVNTRAVKGAMANLPVTFAQVRKENAAFWLV